MMVDSFYRKLVNALGGNRNTLDIGKIIELWSRADAFAESESQSMVSLQTVLNRLRGEGLVEFQREGASRVGTVLLPGKIRIVKTGKKPVKDRSWLDGYKWHESMRGFANSLSPQTLDEARIISDWLKENDISVPLPLRERSWQIFGYEKHLDSRRNGLFGQLQIPISLIGAYVPAIPLAFRKGVAGKPLLLENHNTWHSFSQWNTGAGRWSGVAYGKGKEICGNPDSIVWTAQECGAEIVEYFGDPDPEGFRILAALAAKCPLPVVSLTPAYEWLAAHPRKNNPKKVGYGGTDVDILKRFVPGIVDEIITEWEEGTWVPQEALNFEILRENHIFQEDKNCESTRWMRIIPD